MNFLVLQPSLLFHQNRVGMHEKIDAVIFFGSFAESLIEIKAMKLSSGDRKY